MLPDLYFMLKRKRKFSLYCPLRNQIEIQVRRKQVNTNKVFKLGPCYVKNVFCKNSVNIMWELIITAES